ncbi:MAG: ABC transporter substrate-binding protein [Burkholderiales bacterium]
MKRRHVLLLFAAARLTHVGAARAQGAATARRIAMLSGFAAADMTGFLDLLHPELERLGWSPGRDVAWLAPRAAEGRYERLPALAAEIVAEKPDVILVQSAPATRAAMQATRTIPIVMVGTGDPVAYGIVADLRRPGGNVTGSSYLADESAGKALQVLKEAVPRLASVALPYNAGNEGAAKGLKELGAVAAALGVRLQALPVAGPGDFDEMFRLVARERTEAVLLIPEPLLRTHREAIADMALRHRLPLAIVGGARYLPANGLLSYGPTTAQYARITARYVDAILRGANPAVLPVEQPANFELGISAKTAKALGIVIPQSLLLRADEVIQ